MNKQKLIVAFNAFVNNKEELCHLLSVATVSPSNWYLEVFENGFARYFPQPGNGYDSEGLLIPVPKLADWEWDSDKDLRDYDSAIDALLDNFEDKLEEIDDER